MSGGPLVLKNRFIGDTLTTTYSFMDDKLSKHFTEDEFLKLDQADRDLIIKTYIPDEYDFDLVTENLKPEEIYDILNSGTSKSIHRIIHTLQVRDALKDSINEAEKFLKNPPTTPPPMPNQPANSIPLINLANMSPYKPESAVLDWNNKSGLSKPVVKDNIPDEHFVTYEFDYNNPKSFFLALIFAVPELMNQLIINFHHVDSDGVSVALTDSKTINKFKEQLINDLNDNTKTDDDVMNIISMLAFVSFGKIIEMMHDLFEELAIEKSETRVIFVNFILEVATIGIRVNDGEEIWGREDNVIEGVSIEFNPDSKVLNVVNQKPYVRKYTELDIFNGWLPSSFYIKYNIHGRKLSNPVYKTSKEFWKRVIFDGYDTNKTPKNTVKYIKSRLK